MEDFAGTTIQLSASNYSIWNLKMEDLLYFKDLYDLIKLGSTKPTRNLEDDLEKMHGKIVGTI